MGKIGLALTHQYSYPDHATYYYIGSLILNFLIQYNN